MPVPNELTRPADESAREGRPEKFERPADTLYAAPNALWFYVFYADHPGNWMVQNIDAGPDVPEEDVGRWWLPVLQQEPAQPGLNGHRTLKTGMEPREAYDQAHLQINRNGGVVLPQSLGYRYERDCVHPMTKAAGTRHIDAWSKPRKRMADKRVKFDFDAQRYYRFLLMLVREGYVPQPSADVIDINKARVAQRISWREAMPDTSGKQAAIDNVKRQLDAAETASVPSAEAAPQKRIARPRKGA